MMDKRRYILAGRLIDGSGAPVRRNILLEIQDGIIISCQPATAFPGDAVGDDLSHCTLVPALVDCTVALLQSPSVGERSLSLAENRIEEQGDIPKDMLGRHIQYCFAHGVLGWLPRTRVGLCKSVKEEASRQTGSCFEQPMLVQMLISLGLAIPPILKRRPVSPSSWTTTISVAF